MTGHDSAPIEAAFRVREATAADNAALLALDRQCVVAASTPVMFDRSPDFFARSRPYAHWRAYVAESGQEIIGVSAVALKSVLVGGETVKAAYLYDLRVAPEYRRVGVAKAVGNAIRAHAWTLAPVVGYSLVMEGNVPSLRFVEGRGSRALRLCALSLLPVEKVPVADPRRLRPVDPAELEAVCRLTGEAHPGSDLFPFPDAASLRDRIERVREVGFRGLFGWDAGRKLTGCFGLWDYSPVMRMRILGAGDEWSWAAGRDLHQVFLMPLGFRGAEGLAEAVRLAAAWLRQETAEGVARVLAVPYDKTDAAYAALDAFHPIRMGFTLFGVDLGGGGELPIGSRPVFVDPADL